MSKVLELVERDTPAKAERFLSFFECEIDDQTFEPKNCAIVENPDGSIEDYDALSLFVGGSLVSIELIYMILEHLSHKMPTDDFERLRYLTRELQQNISQKKYPEDKLFQWGIADGRKWVDRSLKIIGDPTFDRVMYGGDGYLKMKNIFVHANYQYIYNGTLDILVFLSSKP